jgi:hypothetical protein
MTGFLNTHTVIVPIRAATETQKFLRAVGRRGSEGLVLWCGRSSGDRFEVTNILVPRQRAMRSDYGVCAIVDGLELHRINMELYETGLRMIAQVHSHPTEAYHSDTDDEHSIVNTVGGLSLVVPDFATRDFSLKECAIYRLAPSGEWKGLSRSEAAALITIRDQ